MNAEGFQQRYAFLRIGAVPGKHWNRHQHPCGKPGQQTGQQSPGNQFDWAADCAIAQHFVPSACRLYGRNGERFIKARIVIPDSTFCSVVGTGQVVINLIGHCQSLDCASINARSELVTVKVDGFKAGYQAVRIEELRHTKHPVRVMANLSGDIIWPYKFSVEDFRLFWCKDGGC